MPNTPLWLCHQCRKEISKSPNPWTFHTRGPKYETIVDVVRFCNIDCIAAYYQLIPLSSLAPKNGKPVDATKN